MAEDRTGDFTAQFRDSGGADTAPPSPPPREYTPTPVSALILARKQLEEDTTKTWLLVALAACAGFFFSAHLLLSLSFAFFGDNFSNWPYLVALPVFGGVIGALVLPAVIVIGANRVHRHQYDWTTAELVHGDLALILIDESYGRMLQDWREQTYRFKLGEVYLGSTFAERLHHFGAYSLQYWRMSQGQREFKVTPATPLNCWLDGIALGCASCSGLGCAVWFTVILPLRIANTYPRSIAARRAALDYFSGKWDAALEKKYVNQIKVPPAENWG